MAAVCSESGAMHAVSAKTTDEPIAAVSTPCIGREPRDLQKHRTEAGRGGGKSSFACHIDPLFSLHRASMIAPAKAKSWQSRGCESTRRCGERFAAALILRNVAPGPRS